LTLINARRAFLGYVSLLSVEAIQGDSVLEVNRDVTEVKPLVAWQAALLRDQAATAAKFEAIFNQSDISCRDH
jgi:hypothetical protein